MAPIPRNKRNIKHNSKKQIKSNIDNINDINVDNMDIKNDIDNGTIEEILRKDPLNIEALEIYASELIELNKLKEAEDVYLKMLKLDSSLWNVYFQLSQLKSGSESLDLQLEGITILENVISSSQSSIQSSTSDDVTRFKFYLSNAYSSVAELYMTDCCFEEGAEEKCEKYALLAVDTCMDNIDAQLTLASLRLIQHEHDQVKDILRDVLKGWIPSTLLCISQSSSQSSISQSSISQSISSIDDVETMNLPEYSCRVGMVKLCMELEWYEIGLFILETLQNENDEVIQVWYLYSMIFWLQGCQILLLHEHDNNHNSNNNTSDIVQEYVDNVSNKNIEMDDKVEEYWQQSFECLEIGKGLIEKDPSIVNSILSNITDEMVQDMQQLYSTLSLVLPNQ